ncbi:hypothetical protein E2493_14580 [Sphingomonas parva]|uniref:DUF2927 domain-containing protein n=1 Tax=Sphingomonas parva TaxID=2555898 RepID=A0A4Y8ZNK3_9SPHN|nr:hypothetical protein [Sphingomonas parva]TFI57588.1 hypothetical protein E2493_14580 [Sphingomonas parva]
MLNVALALLLGGQAAAATPPQDEIVVTGQRPDRRTAQAFVASISRPVGGQLPVFTRPVCPEIIGLAADQAERIAARVRRLADHVGLDVETAGCRPNLHIVVVSDGQQFVSELNRTHADYFTGIEGAEMKALLKSEAPARGWSNTQLQNEDGLVYADVQSGGSSFDPRMRIRTRGERGMLSPVTNGDGRVMRVMSASITKLPTRQSTVHSFVVLDQAALIGKSLVQIADYAAMRTLAAARPPAEGTPVDTILTLFDDPQAPLSVTVSDVAYLKALYGGLPTASYFQQLSRLSKAVMESTPAAAEAATGTARP